ncbi:MAG: ABC transporter substrate-binding protein, partial [Pollutimonas bauzanensis]
AGSSTAAIAGAILNLNYGIGSGDFSLVPGNEPRLVQFLAQKEVDAAALRNVTIAQLKDLKVRSLGTFADEWRKLTKSDSVPYNAIGVVRTDWLDKNPELAAKAIVALRKALEYGRANPQGVVAAVKKAANLPDDAAKVYADLWDENYRVSFTEADRETLKRMFALFKESGVLKGDLPDSALDSKPYEQSLKIK